MIDICRIDVDAQQPMSGNSLFEYQLKDGPLVHFRDVTPADAELIAESIRTASAETLLHRFFSPIRSVPLETLRTLLVIDRPASLCLVGEIREGDQSRIICGARFVRSSTEDAIAEFAITVHDEFQHQGLGSYLLRKIAEEAKAVGVSELEGYVLYSNTGMLRLIQKMTASARWTYQDEVVRVVIPTESLLEERTGQSDLTSAAPTESKAAVSRVTRIKSKPRSMKRMLLKLARLLSLKRHPNRLSTNNDQPAANRPKPMSFRRRPR